MVDIVASARAALAAWGLDDAELAPLGNGLINRTFLVERAGVRAVLQQVSAIFDPRIHENIDAVTRRLASSGQQTLELIPTDDGALYRATEAVWRLYRHVDGVAFDVADNLVQVRSAARLVGAFHAALDGLDHTFVGMRLGVHDTERHLVTLSEAVAAHGHHPLFSEVRELADQVFARVRELPPLPRADAIVGHGDLKLSNVLFERGAPNVARCLVDLDTVGPILLAHELGDMWRSWCNRATEDDHEACLDLDVFAESAAGYREGRGRALTVEERASALLGLDWISLELTARFAADALNERYFGWNPEKFATRGAHNLRRARGQWSLHEAAVRSRQDRRAILFAGVALPGLGSGEA